MKAILEFDLNDHDGKREHLRAIKSLDMAIVLFEMTHNIKRKIENKIDVDEIKTPQDAIDEVFKELFELLDSQNINIDELID